MPSAKNGDWTHYTSDMRGTRYVPLDQINATNFNKLEVAWRFKTDNLGTRPEFKLEGTPLAIRGTLYTTAGTRRSVISLDGRTGELIWSHSYREGNRAAIAPRQLSGRGVSYWTDGKGDERILYVTPGYRLIALNAKTGAMIPTFGEGGVVDLKKGAVFGKGQQIDLETGEIGLHSTPTVVKDTVIVGSSFKEGMTVKTHNNTKGMVRAFDVKTGKVLWTFNTIPRPGEFGNDTWENESWATNGNTGVWSQITVDEEAGLAYLPVEDPTSDFYGGHRPGNNLYGDSLVCVDIKTGQRKWHFQIVHHPIWDYDLSSAPILLDVNVNGKPVKAVALPSKEAFLYVFDRITGQPVWPIEERPVPQSDVPGEKTSPTQPFPTKPPAYARQSIGVDDLIDFTPELNAEARRVVSRYRLGPMFLPGVVSKVEGPIAALTIATTAGGTNWPGAAADPENHIVYAQASNHSLAPIGLIEPPAGFSDIRYVAGTAGQPFVEREGPGFGSAADAPQRPGAPAAPPAAAPAPARGAAPAGAVAGASAGRWRRSRRAGASAPEAAVRPAERDRSRQRRAQMAGAARRHAGRGAQQPAPEGHEHPEDRSAGQRGCGRDEVARRARRPVDHDHGGPSARRDAARLRPEHRQGDRRGLDAGAAERLADDLHGGWPAVHHRRGQRRQLLGRVHRVCAAGVRRAADAGRRTAVIVACDGFPEGPRQRALFFCVGPYPLYNEVI